MNRLLITAAFLIVPATSTAQARASHIRPSTLFAAATSIRDQASGPANVTAASAADRNWALEGLLVGTAIGIGTCATDDTDGESCLWKIPVGAIAGYALGRWLMPRK